MIPMFTIHFTLLLFEYFLYQQIFCWPMHIEHAIKAFLIADIQAGKYLLSPNE